MTVREVAQVMGTQFISVISSETGRVKYCGAACNLMKGLKPEVNYRMEVTKIEVSSGTVIIRF